MGPGVGVAPLITNPSDPLEKLLLPGSKALCSACLRGCSFRGRNVSTRKYNGFSKLEVDSYPFPLGSQSLNQQAKRQLLCWLETLILIIKGEIGLLLHGKSKEEYIWNIGDPIGHLILTIPVIKVNEK